MALSLQISFASFLSDDEGATAVEYGLIVSLITIVLVAGLVALGSGSDGMWDKIVTRAGGSLR